MYPKELCDSILASIAGMRTTPQDRGRHKPSHTFAVLFGGDDMSKYDQVVHRLQELHSTAKQICFADLINTLVDPWISDSPLYRSDLDPYALRVPWRAVWAKAFRNILRRGTGQ